MVIIRRKSWKHINLEQRAGIAHNDKLIRIAEKLEIDSINVSKEVIRNKIPTDYLSEAKPTCFKHNKM